MNDFSRAVRTKASLPELATIEFHGPTLVRGDEEQTETPPWLEGGSGAIDQLRNRAEYAAASPTAVVVLEGERGSGKLRVAQWIHRRGRRGDRPLMVVEAADPAALAQLERVIHGVGTGAGVAPGTLVVRGFHDLDPHGLQALLQLLTVQGAQLRCGLILTTSRDVAELRAGSLQMAQLLGRTQGVIRVPALRNRPGDIGPLARTFVAQACARWDKRHRGLSPRAIAALERHRFPGNVHELKAMVDQAVLRAQGDWLTADCFPGIEGQPHEAEQAAEVVIRLPGSSLREIEIQALKLALRLSGGRIVRASELLGITRHALRRKLEKFGLSALRNDLERAGAGGVPQQVI